MSKLNAILTQCIHIRWRYLSHNTSNEKVPTPLISGLENHREIMFCSLSSGRGFEHQSNQIYGCIVQLLSQISLDLILAVYHLVTEWIKIRDRYWYQRVYYQGYIEGLFIESWSNITKYPFFVIWCWWSVYQPVSYRVVLGIVSVGMHSGRNILRIYLTLVHGPSNYVRYTMYVLNVC